MQNPLMRYKTDSGVMWKFLAEKTGLTRQTLRSLSQMTPKQVEKVQLSTYKALKDQLGIDLLTYIKE